MRWCGGDYWLPELEILQKIPEKDLFVFKAACKLWRKLIISHPTFQNYHLNHSRSSDRIILATFSRLLGYSQPDVSILSTKLGGTIADMRVENLPFNFSRSGSVKASCDGLLLVCDHLNGLLFLYNPVTSTCNHLPDRVDDGILVDFSQISDWIIFNDISAGGKYKVWGFQYSGSGHFLLLTVGEDSWRRCSCSYHMKPLAPPIFFKNKLHWLLFDSREPHEVQAPKGPDYHHTKKYYIAVMDVTEIKVWYTPLALELHGQRHLLSTVKGFLCITRFSSDRLCIFVLEGVGGGCHRWFQRYATTLQYMLNLPLSLKSLVSDDICIVVTRDLDGSDFSGLVKIFIHDEDQLICYDLKHQESRIIGLLTKDQCLRHSYQFYSSTFVQV